MAFRSVWTGPPRLELWCEQRDCGPDGCALAKRRTEGQQVLVTPPPGGCPHLRVGPAYRSPKEQRSAATATGAAQVLAKLQGKGSEK